MKKLLIVSWHGLGDQGGLETMTQYMVHAWNDMFDIEIVDFDSMYKKSIYRKLLGKHYALDAILVSLYTNIKIRKYGRENVRVVTQGYNAPFVRADIAFSHGNMRSFKIAVFQDKRWRLNQLFEAYSWKKSDKVVAVSEYAKNTAVELYHIKSKKIIVVENCVDTDIFYPMDRMANDVYTILFVGRLEIAKGLQRLLDIANKIEENDEFRLIIATPVVKNAELFKEMRHTEVRIGLNKYEMSNFYNDGNILYFPTLSESFGLVTVEALSSGIPVMGTDMGVLGDIYHQKAEGVALLGKDVDEDLLIVKKLVDSYYKYDQRMCLHEAIVKKYSSKLYYDKLKELWN